MENYVSKNYGKMYLADGEPLDILGVEDICLKMLNSSTWNIHKVRQVLKLMHNFILIGRLYDEGHNVTFTGGAWKVTKMSWLLR